MRSNLFWPSNEQSMRIEPHLPTDLWAKERDDRRIISGIVHALKSGCRWKDCPAERGPHTTVYNRFEGTSARKLAELFVATAGNWGGMRDPALESRAKGILRMVTEEADGFFLPR